MTTETRITAHPPVALSSCVFDDPLPEPTGRRRPRVDAAPHDAVEIVAGAPTEPARDAGGIGDDGGDVAGTAAGDRHLHVPPGEPGDRFEDLEDADAAAAPHVQHARTAAGVLHVPHGGA